MARIASPWFWEERQAWYVNKDGQRRLLGEHPEGAPPPRKSKGKWNAPSAIVSVFHALMAEKPEPRLAVAGLTVAEVYDKFLTWCKKHREPLTHKGYLEFIQGLINYLKEKALLPALELKPFNVAEWVDSHSNWGPTRCRNAIIHVARPYNWAFKVGHIPDNPLRYIEKPQANRRENPVGPQDFTTILAKVKDEAFRNLLTFAWETGCRPQELRHIEPHHVKINLARIELPPAEAKGRKRWRIIRLNEKAIAIVRKLLELRNDGKLFMNTRRKPWTNQAIVCRFQKLKKKLGKTWAAYDFRHGYAQKLLENGADMTEVAALMGHANANMIATVYSHMDRAEDHLAGVLKRVSSSEE
ncbi:MAG TPA: tyrosine-type recombinase/integrase [Gemmataceae bacterium]|nr:tyrosine-type recombinase/integrase [Gemmataceae bacterium]